jgi:hypothetical protein
MDALAAVLSIVVFVAVMLRILGCAQEEHKRVVTEAFLRICKEMREAEEKEEK